MRPPFRLNRRIIGSFEGAVMWEMIGVGRRVGAVISLRFPAAVVRLLSHLEPLSGTGPPRTDDPGRIPNPEAFLISQFIPSSIIPSRSEKDKTHPRNSPRYIP